MGEHIDKLRYCTKEADVLLEKGSFLGILTLTEGTPIDPSAGVHLCHKHVPDPKHGMVYIIEHHHGQVKCYAGGAIRLCAFSP